jgi:hypothetical protein
MIAIEITRNNDTVMANVIQYVDDVNTPGFSSFGPYSVLPWIVTVIKKDKIRASTTDPLTATDISMMSLVCSFVMLFVCYI